MPSSTLKGCVWDMYAVKKNKNKKHVQYTLASILQQLSHVGSKTEPSNDRLEWRVVTVIHRSLLCPSSAHWSARLERGWAQLAFAPSHKLRSGASCQSGSCKHPDNVVRILPEPGAALRCQLTAGFRSLSAHSGSQESKRECTSVTYKKSMVKKALASVSLLPMS